MAAEIALRDTIILTQIRDMLGHLVFDSFVISCGTCRESLHEMGCEEIFGCEIADVTKFVMDNFQLDLKGKIDETALYHTPCHDSFDGDGRAFANRLFRDVTSVPNCCSEAGTLAISRPDISYAMLERKRESLTSALPRQTSTVVATNCPSCISGLGRNKDLGIEPRHMATILAEAIGGLSWQQECLRLVKKAEKVTY